MRENGSVLLKVWPSSNNGNGPAQYTVELNADQVPFVY
jgi:hypothetical protein